MPFWTKLNNIESSTPLMEQLTFFNDTTVMVILTISIITLMMSFSATKMKLSTRNTINNQPIEISWPIYSY